MRPPIFFCLLAFLCTLAAPVARADGDRMHLVFEVNDAVAHRLIHPVIVIDMVGMDPVVLVDDGSVFGDVPGDAIFSGTAEVRRVPQLTFSLTDGRTGVEFGKRTVFLPAANEARLAMRTTQGDPPLLMESEEGVSASGDGAAPAPAGAVGGTSSAGTGDRFSYLLWVVLLVGLLGFGYLRIVVRRLYVEDFLPTWKKLDRWLERELGDGP